MLMIAIPTDEVPLLMTTGANVRINGKPTVLNRNGDYLCYDGNRCKIIDEFLSDGLVHFSAASDGDEDFPHSIIRPAELMNDQRYMAIAARLRKMISQKDSPLRCSPEIEQDVRRLVRRSIVLPLGSKRRPKSSGMCLVPENPPVWVIGSFGSVWADCKVRGRNFRVALSPEGFVVLPLDEE